MSQFVFFALLLALLAVAFSVSALWQQSRRLAIALALALPLAAAGIYQLIGTPEALDPAMIATPTTMEDAVAQLQQRLAAEPDNFEGQALLARSYMAMEKFELAREAYARALKLRPEETDLAVEYAESLLRTSADRRFPPEAVALLEKAIEKNPGNQRALFFLGTHLMQEGRPAEAAATWETLLPLLDPQTGAELRKQVDMARSSAGLPPLPADAGDPSTAPGLDITIDIDPALAASAAPGDVLFVFARAPGGGGPPFAAKRIELGQLPMRLQLGDADSPMPSARLSSQKSVVLIARLSKAGDARAAPGDLEAEARQIDIGDNQPITLTLSRRIP